MKKVYFFLCEVLYVYTFIYITNVTGITVIFLAKEIEIIEPLGKKSSFNKRGNRARNPTISKDYKFCISVIPESTRTVTKSIESVYRK